MSINRLFYTVKFSSSLLKEYRYNFTASFKECLKSNLIISLSDSQILKSIRDITGKNIDRNLLEEWYAERDHLKKSKNITKEKRQRINELQDKIYDMMYIPEYITIVMESTKDYDYMYKNGVIFNGKLYKRCSCSASQARVSTIVFVDDSIKEELLTRLNNGRDLNHPLAPSKFNAYMGLYSSSTKRVTTPRFCIVPDCEVEYDVDVNYVIEKDKNTDDIIEERTITNKFNLFDGSGLISPSMAKQWGKELGEDYTPCNFCLRYAFTKGMVNEFDFVKWCEVYNNGNYIIKDIWGKDVDLRNIDVILSEGQVKLWDSWESQEELESNSKKNGIFFGITKYSPKKDKKVLLTNYQYLQVLNLSDDMIKDVCEDTIKYIKGVSYDDIYYTLLFLMGESNEPNDIYKFLKSSDNYWLKSLILNHNLINDKFTKEKIRDFIVRKIEQACLGRLIVKGNYMCICPDPFAYIEWICYRDKSKVKGLLNPHEAYVDFWNKQGLKDGDKIDSMRSPLTHFSEHGIDTLRCTEEMKEWYKYCYSGYICNIHDDFTMVHAGSDYDYDIISSTDNKNFVNGKYPNQRVVTYDVKKPKKKIFTEDDLFITDTFSFGTQIGQITNTCSSICALMAQFPKNSKEYKALQDRLAAGCAAQSRQIDKTKIGENVKTMATVCKQFQHIDHEKDSMEEILNKQFLNRILADKKPYFFKYKYKTLNKELNDFIKRSEENAEIHFGKTIEQLQAQMKEDIYSLTSDEVSFLDYYERFYPVINSDCVMNKICKYIESIDFQIKSKIKSTSDFDYKTLLSDNFVLNKEVYKKVKEEVEITFKEWEEKTKSKKKTHAEKNFSSTFDYNQQMKFERDIECKLLKERLEELFENYEDLANYLVYLFYCDKPSYSKSTLWNICGKQIYENIRSKIDSCYFPIKDDNGDLEYLYENYQIKKIILSEETESKNNEYQDDNYLLEDLNLVDYGSFTRNEECEI